MNTAIKLYCNTTSTNSQRAIICLREKGLTGFEIESVNLMAMENLTQEFLAINPLGFVPVLQQNGEVIADSWVICEYLEETIPEPSLMPSQAQERARVRAWVRYLDEVVADAIRTLTFQARRVPLLKSTPLEEIEATIAAHPTRSDFYRRMGQDGFSEEELADAEAIVEASIEKFNAMLIDSSGNWLINKEITLADIASFPLVSRLIELGFGPSIIKSEPLSDWYQLMLQRDSTADLGQALNPTA